MSEASTLEEGPARVEAFWRHDDVSPPAESRRLTDATKVGFPLQIVLIIVAMLVSAFSGAWGATQTLNTKIDNSQHAIDLVNQKLADAAELEKVKAQLDQERSNTLKEAIATLNRQQELQRYEIQTLKDEMKGKR